MATTTPLPTHQGYTWRDMPGADDECKRMNFSLFKRGKKSLAWVTASHSQHRRMAVNPGTAFTKRRRAAL